MITADTQDYRADQVSADGGWGNGNGFGGADGNGYGDGDGYGMGSGNGSCDEFEDVDDFSYLGVIAASMDVREIAAHINVTKGASK